MKGMQWVILLIVLGLFVEIGAGAENRTPESAFNWDPWPAAKEGPVKVFILAGHSNMQGHASVRTIEYLIYNEETAPKYRQWKNAWLP